VALVALCVIKVVLSPAEVVLGHESTVEVTIEAPAGTPRVAVAASTGTLDPPAALAGQPGRFVTHWHPPPERYPQVALVGAWTEAGDGGLGVLRLLGAAVLPIEVDAPEAALQVTVAGRTYRARSDAQGRAELRFVAPPGTASASVRAVDRLGNIKLREVPLVVPESRRLLVVPHPGELVADGRQTARVLAFAATPRGEPAPDLVLSGPGLQARSLAPGVVAGELPGRRELGTLLLTARADVLSAEAAVRYVAGPPAALEARVEPLPASPGSYGIVARVLDAGGHSLAVLPRADSATGTVTPFESGEAGYRATYRAHRRREPGEVVVTVGALQQRLAFEAPPLPLWEQLRWDARAALAANTSAVTSAGLRLGGYLPLSRRLFVAGQLGLLLASGQVDSLAAQSSDFSFVAVPLRAGLGLLLMRPSRWQPYLLAHTGAWVVAASARGRTASGMTLPDVDQLQTAFDAGAELGLWRQLGPGALAVGLGGNWTPVVGGDLLSGSLCTLELSVGYRLP
jgi:hypothetical protein